MKQREHGEHAALQLLVSLQIQYATMKRHVDCRSMEQYLMGGPSTIHLHFGMDLAYSVLGPVGGMPDSLVSLRPVP
jgi:uncharacterized membrane protein (DUF2068 family)